MGGGGAYGGGGYGGGGSYGGGYGGGGGGGGGGGAVTENRGGTVVNMISATAYATPKNRIGRGGWGMGYAMTKAAFERVAPLLEVEHADDGIRAFNVDPGHVPTERQIAAGRAKQYEGNFTAGTPEAIGAAVAWLCTSPEAAAFRGRIAPAQQIAKDHGLR